MRRLRFGDTGNKVLGMLAFASWLLLVVSWVMSVYAYSRLPQEVLGWSSFLSGQAVWKAKSISFFIYPLAQTLFFVGLLVLANATFFKAFPAEVNGDSLSSRRGRQVTELKKEVIYLGLIFINLVFIHLQTSLILVSHQLAKGINRFYLAMLFMVLFLLVPYYRVRRQMIRAGSR